MAEAGLEDEVDVIVGTLGKALGSYGAYVCCDAQIAKYLINTARTLIFSTALPPPAVAAREIHDLRERGDVAVHREDGVGDDQRAAALRVAQAPREVVDVGVAVHERLGAREAARVVAGCLPAVVREGGVLRAADADREAAPARVFDGLRDAA